MDIGTALIEGARALEQESIAVPRLTAEVLLCHVLGCERAYLFAHPERQLSEAERNAFDYYLNARLDGKPTQYITGKQEFFGREFRVSPDVLIPRPETEHVIEAALPLGARRVLDVGSGSGILAVTLQLETGAETWGSDISLPSLRVAAENARRLGAQVHWVACDLAAAFAPGSMDLIVSNPPYVPLKDEAGLQREVRDWEPRAALFGGPTGLEIYGRLVEDATRVLRAGGWLVVELGFGASERVAAMVRRWTEVRVMPDLAGIPRVLAAQK